MKKYTDRINRRLVAVFAAFCVGMAGLSVRLYSLTTSDGLMQTAQSQRVYTLQVLDERGMIYDCGMQPLVAEGERYLSAVYPTPGNQQAVLDAVPAGDGLTVIDCPPGSSWAAWWRSPRTCAT